MKLLGPFFSPDIMKKYQAKENKEVALIVENRNKYSFYFRWQT